MLRHNIAWMSAILVTCACCHTLAARYKGFELHFITNDQIYENFPVTFAKPVPRWLEGRYIRNGLGRFEMGHRNFTHAFDGYAKLSSVTLTGSAQAYFTTKFIESTYYKKSLARHDVAPYLLFESTDPPFGLFQRLQALYNGIENTNTEVFAFGSPGNVGHGFVAVSDFWPQYQFDPVTLGTVERVAPSLPSGGPLYDILPVPSSSHPVREAGTDNYINFYSILNPIPGPFSRIDVVRIKSVTDRELIASIPRNEIPYMHSLGVSENYAIIFAHPALIDAWKMVRTGVPVQSLTWDPAQETTLYVVDLKTGRVQFFRTAPSVFHMHAVNSFEDGDSLYVDVVTYPDLEFIKSLEMAVLLDKKKRRSIPSNPSLRRYLIDLHAGTVRILTFPPSKSLEFVDRMDMPSINVNYQHNNYCVVFGLTMKAKSKDAASLALVKRNICVEGEERAWLAPDMFPSEPWFMPRPGATEEDDGVVLNLILDGRRAKSLLAMFDGRTLELINYAYLPTYVPFTIHGRFFSPHDIPRKISEITAAFQEK